MWNVKLKTRCKWFAHLFLREGILTEGIVNIWPLWLFPYMLFCPLFTSDDLLRAAGIRCAIWGDTGNGTFIPRARTARVSVPIPKISNWILLRHVFETDDPPKPEKVYPAGIGIAGGSYGGIILSGICVTTASGICNIAGICTGVTISSVS